MTRQFLRDLPKAIAGLGVFALVAVLSVILPRKR